MYSFLCFFAFFTSYGPVTSFYFPWFLPFIQVHMVGTQFLGCAFWLVVAPCPPLPWFTRFTLCGILVPFLATLPWDLGLQFMPTLRLVGSVPAVPLVSSAFPVVRAGQHALDFVYLVLCLRTRWLVAAFLYDTYLGCLTRCSSWFLVYVLGCYYCPVLYLDFRTYYMVGLPALCIPSQVGSHGSWLHTYIPTGSLLRLTHLFIPLGCTTAFGWQHLVPCWFTHATRPIWFLLLYLGSLDCTPYQPSLWFFPHITHGSVLWLHIHCLLPWRSAFFGWFGSFIHTFGCTLSGWFRYLHFGLPSYLLFGLWTLHPRLLVPTSVLPFGSTFGLFVHKPSCLGCTFVHFAYTLRTTHIHLPCYIYPCLCHPLVLCAPVPLGCYCRTALFTGLVYLPSCCRCLGSRAAARLRFRYAGIAQRFCRTARLDCLCGYVFAR